MKASILLLCWNYERYISQCLSSIFAQTYTDIEILFLDNASSDNSFNTAKLILNRSGFNYQVYKNQEPLSVPKNLNFLLEHATGDYIFPFSADDWMAPENIAEKIRLLEAKPETGLVFGGGWYYYEHTNTYIKTDTTKFKRGNMVNNLLLDRVSYFHPGPAYKRKAIYDVGKWDESLLVEDLDLNLRIAMKYQVDFVPKLLIYYRRHASSFLSNYHLMNQGFQQYLEKYKSYENLPMNKWMASNYKHFSIEALRQKKYGLSIHFLGQSIKMDRGLNAVKTALLFTKVYFSKFPILRKVWIPLKNAVTKM